MTLRAALAALAISISLLMYLPLWARIVRRQSSTDFSKTTQWAILLLQVLGWTMAYLDGARTLYLVYYPAQGLLVGFTTWLVYRYYNE